MDDDAHAESGHAHFARSSLSTPLGRSPSRFTARGALPGPKFKKAVPSTSIQWPRTTCPSRAVPWLLRNELSFHALWCKIVPDEDSYGTWYCKSV